MCLVKGQEKELDSSNCMQVFLQSRFYLLIFFSVDTLYAHTDISESLASGVMCLKTPNVNIHSYPRSVGHPLESARIYYPWTLNEC